MPKATQPGGNLIPLENCYILIPNLGGGNPVQIYMRMLPELSDSKSASFPEESLMGRATPLKTYSHSETRSISWTVHFIATTQADIQNNLSQLRALESCVYPVDQSTTAPYEPPNLCRIKCGSLLGDDELCAALKSYSVKFPPDVTWDSTTYLPYKFDVDLQFDVVYDSSDLPGADRIWTSGD